MGAIVCSFWRYLGPSFFWLEIPFLDGVALTWARRVERCGRHPSVSFLGGLEGEK